MRSRVQATTREEKSDRWLDSGGVTRKHEAGKGTARTRTETDGERLKKKLQKQGREGGMRQHGRGAGTANDGGKGRGRAGQHETNHIATRYREKREDLRSRERELNKREPESKKPKSNVYRKKGGDSKTGS